MKIECIPGGHPHTHVDKQEVYVMYLASCRFSLNSMSRTTSGSSS